MPYDPQKNHRHSIRLKGRDYSSPGAYFVTICLRRGAGLLGGPRNGVMWMNDAGRIVEEVWLSLPERFDRIALDAYVVMPDHFHGILWILEQPSAKPIHHLPGPPSPSNPTPPVRPIQESAASALPPNHAPPVRPIQESATSAFPPNHASLVRPIHESAASAPLSDMDHSGAPIRESALRESGRGESRPDDGTSHTTHAEWQKQRRRMLLPQVIGYFKMNASKRINRLRNRRGSLWMEDYYERIIRSERELRNVRRYISKNFEQWRHGR